MADLPRGPLEIGRREQPPLFGPAQTIAGRLLTLTLATAIPLPLGAAHSFPLQAQFPERKVQNLDTTLGSPKTLRGDNQLPFRAAPFFQQVQHRAEWQPVTASGTAINTFPILVTSEQRGPLLQAYKDRPPQVFNTTRGMLVALFPATTPLPPGENDFLPAPQRPQQWPLLVYRADNPPAAGVTPLPPGEAIFAPLERLFWQPIDATRGTPKNLIPDDTISVEQQPDAQAPSPPYPRMVRDTSQSAFALQKAPPPPPPFIIASHFPPLRFFWQPPDTSASTSKGLIPDAVVPIVNLPYPTPDPVRPVTNTTQQSFGTFYPFIPPQPPAFNNYRSWAVKAIGIKTRISVNSQVDADTGDS